MIRKLHSAALALALAAFVSCPGEWLPTVEKVFRESSRFDFWWWLRR